MMKIAIDAIGIDKFGGGRTATLYLLEELFRLDPNNRYEIALSRSEASLQAPNVNQWIIPFRNRFLSRLFAQATFPIRYHNFSVIHFMKNLGVFGRLPKCIVTMFDMTHVYHPELMPFIDSFYYKTIQKQTLKKSERIIVISKDVGQGVSSYYNISPGKIDVVYLAAAKHFVPVTAEKIQRVSQKFNLPTRFFVHVGHLDRKKNLPVLVEAFAQVKKETGFDGKLVLVGERYPKGHDAELLPRIKALHLENDVILTGGVADEDLPAILSGAYAKVFPSIHEGFGLAALEAMACGTALIAGQAGAVKEIAGDGAIILPVVTSSTLAEAMKSLIVNPAFRDQVAKQCLERSREFSWEESARKVLQIYQEVANS